MCLDIRQTRRPFGATSAVLRYNRFSRLIALLFKLTFGIALVAYFDDFGALAPESLCRWPLREFGQFRDTLGIKLKANKAAFGRIATFVGLEGEFPHPANEMRIRISLSPDTARNWGDDLAHPTMRSDNTRRIRIDHRAPGIRTEFDLRPLWDGHAFPDIQEITFGELSPPA